MFILKLALLFLSSIGFIACSKKDKPSQGSSAKYQVRVLQKNDKNQVSVRNVTTELGLNDIIYLDSNTSGIINYDRTSAINGFSVHAQSFCTSDGSTEIEYSAFFENREIQVHTILPPQTLISLATSTHLRWDCRFKLVFKDTHQNSYQISFKRKKIIPEALPTVSLLYDASATPTMQTEVKESDFTQLSLAKLQANESVELICENFFARYFKNNLETTFLSSLTHNPHYFNYKESTFDPRVQIPSQKCILKVNQKEKAVLSSILDFNFKSAKPELSCVIHTKSFGAGSHSRVASLYYKNPHDFPITIARDIHSNQIFVNKKWISAGSRNSDGSAVNKNEYNSVSLSTAHTEQKIIGRYQYFWIPSQQVAEVQVHIQPHNVGRDPLITIHHINDICRVHSLKEMFNTFESISESEIYLDPN